MCSHHEEMIGFHEHTTDPRSGRPQPHQSWAVERVATCATWGIALACAVEAVANFLKWRDIGGTAELGGGAVLFALLAYLRTKGLQRRKDALRIATEAYEEVLARQTCGNIAPRRPDVR